MPPVEYAQATAIALGAMLAPLDHVDHHDVEDVGQQQIGAGGQHAVLVA